MHEGEHQMNHGEHSAPVQNKISKFLPLIIIFALILSFTISRQIFFGQFDMLAAMQDFMGSFFLIFGAFKILNLKGFVDAYAIYDIIAKRFRAYGYVYPFIELALGVAFFTRFIPVLTNWVTLIVMTVSAIGVWKELAKKNNIPCACLGVVFKIPMTKVTLFEDLLMSLMALIMLLAL